MGELDLKKWSPPLFWNNKFIGSRRFWFCDFHRCSRPRKKNKAIRSVRIPSKLRRPKTTYHFCELRCSRSSGKQHSKHYATADLCACALARAGTKPNGQLYYDSLVPYYSRLVAFAFLTKRLESHFPLSSFPRPPLYFSFGFICYLILYSQNE